MSTVSGVLIWDLIWWHDFCGDAIQDWSCAWGDSDFISVGISHEIEPMPKMTLVWYDDMISVGIPHEIEPVPQMA